MTHSSIVCHCFWVIFFLWLIQVSFFVHFFPPWLIFMTHSDSLPDSTPTHTNSQQLTLTHSLTPLDSHSDSHCLVILLLVQYIKGSKSSPKRQANYTRTPGVVNFTIKSTQVYYSTTSLMISQTVYLTLMSSLLHCHSYVILKLWVSVTHLTSSLTHRCGLSTIPFGLW